MPSRRSPGAGGRPSDLDRGRALTLSITGASPWAAALAVGLAMAAMHATRTFHPPAGIDPLIVVAQDMSWSFLIAPVAVGALLLACFAWLWHNLVRREAWPARWW